MTKLKIRELQIKQGTKSVQIGTIKTPKIIITGMVSSTDGENKRQIKRRKLNQVLKYRQITQSNWKRIKAKESVAPFKLRKGTVIGVKSIVNNENKINIIKQINIIGQTKMLDTITLNKILWKGEWNREKENISNINVAQSTSKSSISTKKPTIQTIIKGIKKSNKKNISNSLQIGLKQIELIKEINYSNMKTEGNTNKTSGAQTNIGSHLIIKNTIPMYINKYIYNIPKLEDSSFSSIKRILPTNLSNIIQTNFQNMIYWVKYKWHTNIKGIIPATRNIPNFINIPNRINKSDSQSTLTTLSVKLNQSNNNHTKIGLSRYAVLTIIKQKEKTIKDEIKSIIQQSNQKFSTPILAKSIQKTLLNSRYIYKVINSVFRLKQSEVEIETKGSNIYTWLSQTIKIPTSNQTNISKKPTYIFGNLKK